MICVLPYFNFSISCHFMQIFAAFRGSIKRGSRGAAHAAISIVLLSRSALDYNVILDFYSCDIFCNVKHTLSPLSPSWPWLPLTPGCPYKEIDKEKLNNVGSQSDIHIYVWDSFPHGWWKSIFLVLK